MYMYVVSNTRNFTDHKYLLSIVMSNAPPDTIWVISMTVFTGSHLTDTNKQNSTEKYRN